jgi:hypothetical protein
MIAFFATLLRLFFQAFRPRRNVLSENALLKKENEILLRKMGKKRAHFNFYDKLFLVVLHRAADIKDRLMLVKPETVLSWQRTLMKRFWTFGHSPAKRGRKPVDSDIKWAASPLLQTGGIADGICHPHGVISSRRVVYSY